LIAASCRAPGVELRRLSTAGAVAGAKAGSQPPVGALTCVAASGCESGLKAWIACVADFSERWSRREASSSRLRSYSLSSLRAASPNQR
jgi:hypothetical protein